jgi:hypothetical protein
MIRVNQTQSRKAEANAEMNSITVIASHGPIAGEHSQGLCMDTLARPFYKTSGRSTMVVKAPYATEQDTWYHATSELQP